MQVRDDIQHKNPINKPVLGEENNRFKTTGDIEQVEANGDTTHDTLHHTALFNEKEHIISVNYSTIGKNTGPLSELSSLPCSNDGNCEIDEQSLKKKEQVLYEIQLTSPPIYSCRGEVINRFKTTGEVEEFEVSGKIPHDKFNLNASFTKNENTPPVQEAIMLKTIGTDDWSSPTKPTGPNTKLKLPQY